MAISDQYQKLPETREFDWFLNGKLHVPKTVIKVGGPGLSVSDLPVEGSHYY